VTARGTRASGGVANPRDVLCRVPPHAEDAEKSVLGCCLIYEEGFSLAQQAIGPEHFYVEAHRAIFEVMTALEERGVGIDPVTVSEELKTRGQFDRVGGAAYLDMLVDAMPMTAYLEDHAAEVRKKFLMREAILRASQVVADAFAGADPVDLSAAFTEASAAVLPPSRELTPAEIMDDFLSGTPTRAIRFPCAGTPAQGGLADDADLGAYIGDMYPGQKLLVAARTSEGKTALMRMLWIACAYGAIPSAYITLEDSEEEIVAGAAGAVSYLTSAGVLARRWSESVRIEGIAIRDWLKRLPLFVKYIPGARPSQVAETVRSMIVRRGVKVVVVDYIQAIAHEGRETRATQLGEILHALTRAAGRDAVLVIGSQLVRPPKDQRDREPELDDMKESGKLEDEAKVCVMLRRSGPDSDDSKRRGVTVFVKKSKFGKTGKLGATLWLRHTSVWPGVTRPTFDLTKGPVPYEPVLTPDDEPPPGEMPGWVQEELREPKGGGSGGQPPPTDDDLGPFLG